MHSETERRLISFINDELGTDLGYLDTNAEVEKYLKLSGDDTVDFIVAFSKKFNVDISKLDMSKYSSGEGLLLNFRLLLKKITGDPINKIIPLTFKDLINAIIVKQLS